jgi:hypothetical protein
MKLQQFRFLNLAGYVLVLVMNTLANALPINGMTTGELSALYPNRFVPAGFTFGIWGLIYLSLLGFVVHQFRAGGRPLAKAIGIWFFLSCVANASWILAWHYRMPLLSLGVMLLLLLTLIQIYRRVQAFEWRDHWLGKLPFQLYLAWISVATIANSTAVLVDAGWEGGPFAPYQWAAIMVGAAALIGLAFVLNFRDIPFGLVLLWAFFGIYERQAADSALLSTTIVTAGGVLLLGLVYSGFRIAR